MTEPNEPLPVLAYNQMRNRPPRRRRSFDEETLKLGVLSLVYLHYHLFNSSKDESGLFLTSAVLLWIFVWLAMLAGALIRRIQPRSRRLFWATFVVQWLTFFQPLTTVFSVYRCPHGTLRYNELIGIARSSTRGPCRNGLLWEHRFYLGGEWYLVTRW